MYWSLFQVLDVLQRTEQIKFFPAWSLDSSCRSQIKSKFKKYVLVECVRAVRKIQGDTIQYNLGWERHCCSMIRNPSLLITWERPHHARERACQVKRIWAEKAFWIWEQISSWIKSQLLHHSFKLGSPGNQLSFFPGSQIGRFKMVISRSKQVILHCGC